MGNSMFRTKPSYISFKCGEISSTNISSLPSFTTYNEIEGITKQDFLINVNKFRSPENIVEDIFVIDVFTKNIIEIQSHSHMEHYQYYALLVVKKIEEES